MKSVNGPFNTLTTRYLRPNNQILVLIWLLIFKQNLRLFKKLTNPNFSKYTSLIVNLEIFMVLLINQNVYLLFRFQRDTEILTFLQPITDPLPRTMLVLV
jgi:hypothetical protein